MAHNVKVCEIDDALKEKLKKFRFRKDKNNAALIIKINKEKQLVHLEEEIEDCSVDDVREALPTHQPRYVVFSYCHEHSDGRISYPLCFIYSTPADCQPELQMMYAGTKLSLVKDANLTKVYEVRETEDITEDWLKEKLSRC